MTKQRSNQLMSTRRGALALVGSVVTSGCLRLSESSVPGSEYYSSRSDAIEYASSFAIDENYSLDYPGNPPELIQHDTVYSSTNGTSGPNGSEYSTNDIIVTPIAEPIEIGGATDRRIHVRDLVTELVAVFQPASGSESISFERFTKVAGFVVVSSGIFDVVKVELVFTGGCDGCASVGASSLESLITVAMSVFLATERLDAARVEAFDHRFE